MIKATFYKNSSDDFVGFSISGHAGFAEYGSDVCCAGVSALAINTVNSIGAFTDNAYKTDVDDTGIIRFRFEKGSDEMGQLLMKSLELGILGIMKDYGKKYVEVHYKEV